MEVAQDQRSDRLAASALAALAAHALLMLAFAVLSPSSLIHPPTPVSVTLEFPLTAVIETPAPAPKPAADATPRVSPQPAVGTQPERPAAPPAPQAAAAAAARQAPSYRQPSPQDLSRALANLGDSRPQASSTDAGVAPAPVLPRASAPRSGDAPPPPPFRANADAGRPAAAASAGAPAGAQTPARPEIDLNSLDRGLAGRGGSTAAGAASSSGPGASGGQPAPAGGGQAGAAQSGPAITWQGAARKLLVRAEPSVPDWVKRDGLSLRLLLSFDVQPSGLVSAAGIDRSSGYADVDAAVLEAVRRWRFESSATNRVVRGSVPYVITPR